MKPESAGSRFRQERERLGFSTPAHMADATGVPLRAVEAAENDDFELMNAFDLYRLKEHGFSYAFVFDEMSDDQREILGLYLRLDKERARQLIEFVRERFVSQREPAEVPPAKSQS